MSNTIAIIFCNGCDSRVDDQYLCMRGCEYDGFSPNDRPLLTRTYKLVGVSNVPPKQVPPVEKPKERSVVTGGKERNREV